MADTNTPSLNLVLPEVGASSDTWGTKINSDLTAIDNLFSTGPYLKVANGGTGAGTAAGAATNLGLGTGNSPQFAELNIGHATDTTITRSAAGVIAVEGGVVPKENRANTFSQPQTIASIQLGNADTTLTRVSAGVASIEGKNIALNGTSEVLTTGSIELGNASDTTITRSAAGVIAVEGKPVVMTTGAQTVEFADGAAATPSITNSGDTNTGIWFPAADTVAVSTNGTEKARFTSNGDLLVGTTSGSARVHAKIDNGAIVGAPMVMIAENTTTGVGAQNGAGIGLSFSTRAVASIEGLRVNQLANYASHLVFKTNAAGQSSGLHSDLTERMRIDDAGRVGIGRTASSSTLEVEGNIRGARYIGRNNTTDGSGFSIYWTGSAAQLWIDTSNVGTITLTSDYRIKKDVATQQTPALGRIAAIRPVTYTYADNSALNWKADGVSREGFIAHELAEIIPSAVDGEKDAEDQVQSLRMDALCSVLVKAIQELTEKNAALEARIAALEAA